MRIFKAAKYTNDTIELTSSKEAVEFRDAINKEEDFFIEWAEGNVIKGKFTKCSEIKSKIDTGNIELTYKFPKGEI